MKEIKLAVLDVDGTLTDGKIYIDNNGIEAKAFNVKDGMAIAQWVKVGLDAVIITGRRSKIVEIRAKELGIKDIYQGIHAKKEKLIEILEEKNIKLSEVVYIGDDINDLEVMKSVGCAACPKNAVKQVKKISNLVSEYNGGDGAVREILELLMEEKGIWEKVIEKYEGVSQ